MSEPASLPIAPDLDLDELQFGLGEVAFNVLEEAAFLAPEPVEEGVLFECDGVIAELAFLGPEPGQKGALALIVSGELAAHLAANLLGVDPEDPDAEKQAGDAVGEILNMIGGRVMQVWFGDAHECVLATPALSKIEAQDIDPRRTSAHLRVSVLADDEFPVELLAVFEA